MKTYEPFTYTVNLKMHQVIEPGDIIDDNGVRLKVLDIQQVKMLEIQEDFVVFDRPHKVTKGFEFQVSMTVRELPGKDDGK